MFFKQSKKQEFWQIKQNKNLKKKCKLIYILGSKKTSRKKSNLKITEAIKGMFVLIN